MTAALFQILCLGTDGLDDGEPLHASGGASGLPVQDGKENAGLSVPLHQPGGNDADDAGIPPLSGEDQHPAVQKLGLPFQQQLNVLYDRPFQFLPPVVKGADLPCQLGGPVLVPAKEQLHRLVHRADAPGDVNPGGDAKGDILRGDGGKIQPCFSGQGLDPQVFALGQKGDSRLY